MNDTNPFPAKVVAIIAAILISIPFIAPKFGAPADAITGSKSGHSTVFTEVAEWGSDLVSDRMLGVTDKIAHPTNYVR